MIEVEFKLNGRKIHPSKVSNQLEKAMLKEIQKNVSQKLKGVRDTKTGVSPKLTFRGRSIGDLSVEISGSPELVKEVKRRLR